MVTENIVVTVLFSSSLVFFFRKINYEFPKRELHHLEKYCIDFTQENELNRFHNRHKLIQA